MLRQGLGWCPFLLHSLSVPEIAPSSRKSLARYAGRPQAILAEWTPSSQGGRGSCLLSQQAHSSSQEEKSVPCLLLPCGAIQGDRGRHPSLQGSCVHGGVAGGHALLLPSRVFGLGVVGRGRPLCSLFQRLMTRLCSWWVLCFTETWAASWPCRGGHHGHRSGWGGWVWWRWGLGRPGLRVEGLGEG